MTLPAPAPPSGRARRMVGWRRAVLLLVASCAILLPLQVDARADARADQSSDKPADASANEPAHASANGPAHVQTGEPPRWRANRQDAAQAGAGAVSPAETLLFETDHLAHVALPAVLVYTFRSVSNIEPGFSDEVRLDLAAAKGIRGEGIRDKNIRGEGTRDKGAGEKGVAAKRSIRATLHFLSGAHAHDMPVLEDAHGNPVLLGFLERDIAEMSRLTGGSAAYFRKRIRMALADHARVEVQTITWNGKSLPARTVRIRPYLDDPMHARFERYVHKTYTFVFSEQVPGALFQLRSSLGDWNMAQERNRDEVPDRVPDRAHGGAQGGVQGSVQGGVRGRVQGGSPDAAVVATTAQAKGTAGAMPAIDETLTLAAVTHPRQ
jgi:hypothetical protein